MSHLKMQPQDLLLWEGAGEGRGWETWWSAQFPTEEGDLGAGEPTEVNFQPWQIQEIILAKKSLL